MMKLYWKNSILSLCGVKHTVRIAATMVMLVNMTVPKIPKNVLCDDERLVYERKLWTKLKLQI